MVRTKCLKVEERKEGRKEGRGEGKEGGREGRLVPTKADLGHILARWKQRSHCTDKTNY